MPAAAQKVLQGAHLLPSGFATSGQVRGLWEGGVECEAGHPQQRRPRGRAGCSGPADALLPGTPRACVPSRQKQTWESQGASRKETNGPLEPQETTQLLTNAGTCLAHEEAGLMVILASAMRLFFCSKYQPSTAPHPHLLPSPPIWFIHQG